MGKLEQIDWTGCELVERIPGKQSGVPLVKDTRIPADQIVEEWELGSAIEEINENYPSISREQIADLITFASQHRSPRPADALRA